MVSCNFCIARNLYINPQSYIQDKGTYWLIAVIKMYVQFSLLGKRLKLWEGR